jgi:hypothetical protein
MTHLCIRHPNKVDSLSQDTAYEMGRVSSCSREVDSRLSVPLYYLLSRSTGTWQMLNVSLVVDLLWENQQSCFAVISSIVYLIFSGWLIFINET